MPKNYQDEIEEILKRSEEAAPVDAAPKLKKPVRGAARKPDPRKAPPAGGSNRNQPPSYRSGRWPAITAGKLMLAGLVLFLIAALLRVSLGWRGMGVLIVVGLGAIAVAYLMLFIRPVSTGGYEKRWRGQPLEKGGSAWKRFTRWLRS